MCTHEDEINDSIIHKEFANFNETAMLDFQLGKRVLDNCESGDLWRHIRANFFGPKHSVTLVVIVRQRMHTKTVQVNRRRGKVISV